MLNLVKMNLYRLFKSKNWIALLVVLMMAFTVSAIQIAMQRSEYTETVISEEGTEINTYSDEEGGVYIETEAVDLTVSEVFAGFNGEFTLLVVGIFAVVYCENERKHGFVKNLSVRKKDKALVFGAKIAPALVFSLETMAASFLGVLLGSVVEGGLPMGDVAGIIKYACVGTLLCTAFSMFSMALYELFRKNVAAVLISAFTAVGLIPQLLFYGEIGLIKLGILSERFATDLDITQHMITMRFNMMNYENMFANKPNNLVIAIIGIAVYLTIGMLLYRKKDVV